jgi:hypothetical protein
MPKTTLRSRRASKPVKSSKPRSAFGTRGSVPVERCQVCGHKDLESIIFIDYLPPVNTMPPVGSRPAEQPAYPAEVLRCPRCELVQLGLVVDPNILFPPEYPYTSGTTKILRENFAELYREVMATYPIAKEDLVVDIGSNDGTLLGNFKDGGHRVLGIEPTDAGKIAQKKGITTMTSFFTGVAAKNAVKKFGKARIVTAANVFAHIENPSDVVKNIVSMLDRDGIFISESHYWVALLETLQYDTIYHEHLRYYSLTALKYLLEMHGLEVIRAKRIPTHGGSIRVYAARKGKRDVDASVAKILDHEKGALSAESIQRFKKGVVDSKLGLLAMLKDIKAKGECVYGVGAPSRSSTLINYVGLNDGIIDCVLEIAGSYKIGKYVPGTVVPVVDEKRLFEQPPEYALLFSWHIADELIPKLKARGYKGKFIVPLPEPRIVA